MGRRREAGAGWAKAQKYSTRSTASTESIDVLDDDGRVTVFRERRIHGGELHGSGCILSAAIAAGLGKGMTLEDSVSGAKRFVWEAIRKASVGVS